MPCQGQTKFNQVIEGNANAARKKGFEAAAINIIAINRQRPIGQPMKSVLAVDDTGAPRGRARKLNGRFDCFRSGIQEQCLVKVRHVFQEPFGENTRESRDVHLNKIWQLIIENAL